MNMDQLMSIDQEEDPEEVQKEGTMQVEEEEEVKKQCERRRRRRCRIREQR